MVDHQTCALFRLQAWAKENLDNLLTECNHITKNQFTKAIVYDTAKLSFIEINLVKVGSAAGLVRHVEIVKDSLIFVFIMLHSLSRRIELVCSSDQSGRSNESRNSENMSIRYRPSALKSWSGWSRDEDIQRELLTFWDVGWMCRPSSSLHWRSSRKRACQAHFRSVEGDTSRLSEARSKEFLSWCCK